MRPVVVPRRFSVHLDLGAVSASADVVRDAIWARVDGLEPRMTQREDGLGVSLTITAADLWLAVLIAMAAMGETDYPAVRLEAAPFDPAGD